MEEREALKRQIELLQNLIDNHKSIHGDIPSGRVQQRTVEASTSASGHSSSFVHPYSSRMRLNSPQSFASWRKTYSLKNKNPQSSVSHPSYASSTDCSTVHTHSRGEESVKIASLSSEASHQRRKEDTKSIIQTRGVETEKQNTDTLTATGMAVSEHGSKKGAPSSSATSVQHKALPKQTQESDHKAKEKHVVLPERKVGVSLEALKSVKASTSASLKSSQQLQAKVSPTGEISTETKRTINPSTATGITAPPPATQPKVSKQPSGNLASCSSHSQVSASFLKSSKFTWVKSQNVGGAEQRRASGTSSSPVKAVTASAVSVSKVGLSSGSFPTASLSKRTPAKKSIRKLSPVAVAQKTSKYKWVSSSAGAQAKISRKSVSPKCPTLLPTRAMEKVEASRKARAALASTVKIRKEIAASRATPSLSNRYRWKAGGQSTPAAMTAGATVSQRRSTIWHWTSGRNNKGLRGGHVTPLSLAQRTYHLPSSSPGAFKLRSKMKIIRKSVSSGGGSEKGTGPSALKLSQRSRPHSSSRSPIGVRKTKLVSFGRHKLRRLSTSLSKTRPASTSSNTEFGSRYKTRLGSSLAHTHLYNPALSWRAKRIQSARCFLQSRQSLRMLHYKQPSPMQQWKGSSMCWIRGSLYRVSANKLSRTVASSMSINRTERSFSSTHGSPMTPVLNQPSTTRHLASRAVQRSLAIIRQAHQKKQPKQYCIYYNRFGKCNRGTSCPFIHDPDKVAVCTRFLRGTCKQADGTCPFSHKVAKEKMPVCSYFLKGICNNSDCPYSHVYVSHKAKVCDDFVKGYCPEGEKCKKKHTLVCPDFSKTGSCPHGARCKLQHRRAAKRNASSSSATPAKRARTKESCKRPQLSVVILQGSQAAPETPTKGPLELPSFISLSSSPEEADAPDTPLADSPKVKEKKLQIKPRL